MVHKPYLLFSTPRSGSSPVFRILAEYLRQTHGTESLEEFFDCFGNTYWESREGVMGPGIRRRDAEAEKFSDEAWRTVVDQRLDMLRRHHGRYCFKLMAATVYPETMAWLHENYEWIYVERENVFEQLQSFLISVETKTWYAENGIRLEERSLAFDAAGIAAFERYHVDYQRWKLKQRPTRVVTYEQFISRSDDRALLHGIGLLDSIDCSRIKLPGKQNDGDKLRFFKDPKKLIREYRSSYLNQIYSI